MTRSDGSSSSTNFGPISSEVQVRRLSSAVMVCALAAVQEPVDVAFPTDDMGEASLTARRTAQIDAARDSGIDIGLRFEDRIEDSGITFVHRAVADSGRDYRAVHYDHGNSVSVADVDGDGLPDLYFVNQLGANQLWRNQGGLRFEDITATGGVGLADRIGVAASFADLDNDGDPDLVVTSVRGGNALFENQGAGRFRERTAGSGLEYSGHSSGVVFLDFDLDGLLDVFVANVGDYTTDVMGEGGYYVGLEDAFEGHLYPEREESSRLYRNLGGMRFEDVTAAAGLADLGWNGDAALVDLDGNALPDLYVLNMQGDDHYLVNQGNGTFADETFDHFARTPYGAMGVAAFDFDNDGDQDLMVTDMHSDMNAAQAPDEEHLKQRIRYVYQDGFRHLMGNAFYRQGEDGFGEESDAVGAENYWPWGLSAEDVNADGWTDVFVASSMNYPFRYHTNALRLNQRGERFVPAEFALGVEPRRDGRVRQPVFELDCASAADGVHERCIGHAGRIRVLGTLGSRSSALVDLDADGDLDLVTAEFNSAPQLFVNDLTSRRQVNWLSVTLAGDPSNRDGLGARVTVSAGGTVYTQVHDGKTGYLAQSQVPLYFGLGDADVVERLEVVWPGGARQVLEGPITARQSLRVSQSN